MSADFWKAMDAWLGLTVVKPDPMSTIAQEASLAAGLPDIAVSPAQGKQLMLLAKMCGAKRILEIGTLGGYSTLWLARALPPDGQLISLEFNPRHAEVARANLDSAGVRDRVSIQIGAALDTLSMLEGPFDFIFIDANKDNYPDYWRWAVKLSRPGSVIVADNAIRHGEVLDATLTDPLVLGSRGLLELAGREPRVEATVIQTVGQKGYDGYLLAVVS